MTQYPVPLARRFAAELAGMMRRIQKLETRTAGIDSGTPLMPLPAVIDPAWTSGDPRVLINGSQVLTGPCKHLSSYAPAAADSVVVLPVRGSYVVLGKLT